MKKLIAIVLAVSMVMAFALTASADVGYTATLNVNWADRQSVTVTGPGTYEFSVDMTSWGEGAAQYAAIIIPEAYSALSGYSASLTVTLGGTVLYSNETYTIVPQYLPDSTGNYVPSDNAYIELYANWNSTNLIETIPYGSKLDVTLTLADPNTSAEDSKEENTSGYTAYLVHKDADWWPGIDETAEKPVTVNVDGPGTYTLSWDLGNDFYANASTGSMMTYIQIPGAEEALSGLTLTALTITADGVDVPVDLSKVLCGDFEDQGYFRIEIYNDYGSTKENSPIDLSKLTFGTNLTITFTLTDPNASTEDTSAATQPTVKPDTTNPKDGDTISLFVALMAVSACGGVIVGKKKF